MKTIKPIDNQEFLSITCPIGMGDFKMFVSVVNKGIDSHLEAFTKSQFGVQDNDNGRFVFNFHRSELHILIRRLEEMIDDTEDETEAQEIEQWVYDLNEEL